MEMHKCIIVGDSGVGKTTFLTKLTDGNFIENHIETIGLEVYPININNDNVGFNCFEIAGGPTFRAGNSEKYLIGADCAIIMFDNNFGIKRWKDWLNQFLPNIPIVYVRTKYIAACVFCYNLL